MPTDKNINKSKCIETKIDDTEAITTHKKETNQEKINKRAKSYDRNKLYNKKSSNV